MFSFIWSNYIPYCYKGSDARQLKRKCPRFGGYFVNIQHLFFRLVSFEGCYLFVLALFVCLFVCLICFVFWVVFLDMYIYIVHNCTKPSLTNRKMVEAGKKHTHTHMASDFPVTSIKSKWLLCNVKMSNLYWVMSWIFIISAH
jgi:hypothetical protein